MGVTPLVISRLENNIANASIGTLRALLRIQETCYYSVLNNQPFGTNFFIADVSPRETISSVGCLKKQTAQIFFSPFTPHSR